MGKPKNDRVSELCSLIEVEKDQLRLQSLLQELERLLRAEQDARPQSDPPRDEGKE